MKIAEEKSLNGVNVTQLFNTIDLIKEKPEVAKFKFRATNRWVQGTHNRATVNGFYGALKEDTSRTPMIFDLDEPPVLLGKNQGANPVEYLLVALPGCLTTSMIAHAASKGIEIKGVQSRYEGDIDLRAFLGISEDVPVGYQKIRIYFTKVRRFLARFPASRLRPVIFKRLYPYLEHSPIRSLRYAEAFFSADAGRYPDACYAHAPRWSTTEKTKLFFSAELRAALRGHDGLAEIEALLDDGVGRFDALSQAQYLEIKTLLSGYLLSSQGDRVAMANSIEGRFPFLDHRVMEFCFRLPARLRMRALTEKYLLKKAMAPHLPPAIAARPKQPYRAPDASSFFGGAGADYVAELLAPAALARAGFFDPRSVGMLVEKCRRSPVLGFKDNMAIVGIISTMLLHRHFVEQFEARAAGADTGVAEATQCDVRG